jgi:hypothetical protein
MTKLAKTLAAMIAVSLITCPKTLNADNPTLPTLINLPGDISLDFSNNPAKKIGWKKLEVVYEGDDFPFQMKFKGRYKQSDVGEIQIYFPMPKTFPIWPEKVQEKYDCYFGHTTLYPFTLPGRDEEFTSGSECSNFSHLVTICRDANDCSVYIGRSKGEDDVVGFISEDHYDFVEPICRE